MKHDHDDDDAPRDAHLLAALRHAPDRDAAPPPEVTARILAAARDAVRPAATAPSWSQRLAAWLRTPQLGAAFGTIVVAVLVGVMWSTREPPQPAEPVAAAKTQAAAPVDAASSQGAAVGSSADAALVAPRANDAPAPTEPRRDAAPAERAKTPRKATATPAQAASPAARPAAPPAATPRARDGVARRVDEAAVASSSSPPVSPPAAEAPLAQAPAVAREADAGRAAAASPPPAPAPKEAAAAGERQPMLERRAEAVAAAATPTPPAPSVVGRLAGKAGSAAANARSGIDAPPLNALLGGAAQDVTWQAGGKTFAHGTTQRAWWAAVRAATAGRWQPDTTLRATPLPAWVGVSEGGRAVATLALDGDALLLTEGGRTWTALVGAATLRAWQDELSRW